MSINLKLLQKIKSIIYFKKKKGKAITAYILERKIKNYLFADKITY